ncbi:MAG: ankyrin repeat domain-containing protein [Acidobacteria bacterium]|nr:ankyrin repeat domain-containing protein [Acidobacteriota bacterium]
MSKLANLVGETLDQKYQIDHQLGQGGMGAVYKATHLGTERPVALKVIMPEFMQEKRFIERFKLEAKAAGRLRHPNVVNVTDFGFAQVNLEQIAYLVMEYLNGFTLGDMLRKQKKLSLNVTIDILEQTCLAVSEAHKLGIVHRDLKPDNIWLEPNGRGGYNVKVLDFGLAQIHDLVVKPQQLIVSLGNETTNSIPTIDLEAKTQAANKSHKSLEANTFIKEETQSQAVNQANLLEINTIVNKEEAVTLINLNPNTNKAKTTSPLALEMEKITQIGAIVGTPLYMSPEQCQGETLDFRTDIYSLGIVVYQMLAGKTPFQGNLNQLLVQHIQNQPPLLTKKDHNIPSSIAKIIMSALDKDPVKRPVSAIAFAAELKASSEGELPILREALSLYRRNFNTFFKTSLFIYFPYLIFYFLLIAVAKSLPSDFSYLIYLLNNSYWLIAILILLFANATSLGIFALVVKEVQKFPQKPISLLPFLRIYFSNFTKIITTALLANVQLLFNYALCVPVILLEQKSSKEALARSSFLVNFLKPTLTALEIRSLFLSIFSLLIAPISFVFINLIFFIINEEKSKLLLEKGSLAAFIFIPSGFILLPAILLILVYPVVAIAFVLFYFKTRIILGENPNQETQLDQANNLELNTRNYAREKRSSLLVLILILTFISWLLVKNIALTLATTGGFTSVVEALILVGANANAKISTSLFDFDGEFTTTPLIHAVSNAKQQKELVATLLKNGANVNTANDYGWTPIMEAVIKDDFETLQVLISHGADVNVTTNQGWTPLMWAIKQSNLAIVKYLLNNNADANMLTENGKTALHISIETGNAYITKKLLDHCDQVNITDDQGNTALSLAAQGGDSYIVKLLIKKNAFIDHQNKVGQTPLILAAINSQKEAIKELLEANAKLETKDNYDKIALDYAKDQEIINLLTNPE